MGGIFKAYDIRGIYGTELDEKIAYNIGRAFVRYLKCKNVVIGKDMRKSGIKLFKALSKGVMDEGARVTDIGVCTTTMLYFSIFNYNHDAGLMITASHNPKEYNGIKLCTKDARSLSGEDGIPEIEKLALKADFGKPKKNKSLRKKDVLPDYVKHCMKYAKDIPKLKVVIDYGNGAGSIPGKPIFKKLGWDVLELYARPDGNFPNHIADPIKLENTEVLRKKVLEKKADLGIAFDGDADRVAFITEKGEFVKCDFITALIAKDLLKKNKKEKVLYEIRSSWVVRDEIRLLGGKPIMWKAGHALIKNKMRKEKIIFGGEQSGHFFFKEEHYTENPFIVVFEVAKTLRKRKLSQLIRPLQVYCHSGEINSKVSDADKVLQKVKNIFHDGKITEIDGVSVEYKDFWFNVRKSNTEPLVRLNLEAKTKEKMEEMRDRLISLIRG